MNEALDFFRKLLDTSDWPPRWHCGKWTEFHGWLYIISDLLIWSAYFAIPLIILKFVSRRSKARFVRAYFLFAAFILACGSTHLLDAVTFWFPAYRLNALVRFITGIVSWTTVFYMVRIMPEAMRLKTTEELEYEVQERRKVELELRFTNQQFSLAQQIANLGNWHWDVRNEKISWSEKLYDIYGIEKNVEINLDAFLNLVHPDDRERVSGIIQSALVNKHFPAFYHRIKAEGQPERILFSKGEVLFDSSGNLTGVIGTVQDVTEQQNAQQALLEKTQALEATNNELQRFAYVASHDLQEPLRKILTFASLLEKDYNTSLDTKGGMYVRKIVQSTSRMQQLIEDILTFSSVKDKRQEFAPVDLQAILLQVLSDMEVQIEQSKAEIEWEELPQVEANASQIGQLFQNLLSNAIKFVRPGEIPRIYIRCERIPGMDIRNRSDLQSYKPAAALPEHFWNETQFILIHITDNGIGFDPVYKEKIFEIFQRLHPGHEYGGTGVGLAICKRIADNHNGAILVQSAEGKGTTFSVLLPVVQKNFSLFAPMPSTI